MIRFGTGTYNVRDTEDIQPEMSKQISANAAASVGKPPSSSLNCTVFFLDDIEHDFFIHKNALGEDLLEKVYSYVELAERDFFGLQFVCILDVNTSGSRMRWLDAKKSIKRQMMCPPYHLYFRVKFYVNDPSKLIEEYTRYLMYLQLRKDIYEGRLQCNEDEVVLLGSYAAQSELGDYSDEEHKEDYLEALRVLPNQSVEVTQKIAQIHRLHKGQVPSEAEFKFLDIAKHLHLYGFDLYEAMDGNGAEICIGVNCNGISIFQNGIKVNSFPWAAIIKLSFKRKHFNIQMKTLDENGDQVDTVLVFNAVHSQNCKLLWKSCIECHTFFRLIAPPTIPQKSLFHLGSRFRYSGRTEYQSVEEMRRKAKVEKNFNRHYSMNNHKLYQPEPQSSTLSTTSNSSAFSATSAADFASKFSSRCRRLLPRGGRAASLLRENIISRKMHQISEMTTVSSLPGFIQHLIPRSASTFKLNQDLTRPDDESFGDDECESAAPSLNPNRRSFITAGSNSVGGNQVVLRNQSATGSALSLRVKPSSRNSSVLGADDIPSPAASSAYSNVTARSSLIVPSTSSNQTPTPHQHYGFLQQTKDKQRLYSQSPYDSTTTSSTLIANSSTTSIPGSEDTRIWQGPNHTTTMIINDPQACTSAVHHHHRNSIALTPNGCRKSMVLSGTANASHNGTSDIGSTNGDKHSSFGTSNGKNIYQLANNDYQINGTVSRRSMINGSSPYKSSATRLVQPNGKLLNGSNNASPRSSIASFTSSYNGYENGSPRGRQSPSRQHSNSPTSITSEDSAVIVRMSPDHQGRFGFNVSGGYDRGYPVIVSRVVSGSPADKCHPRLNVGDMVLRINGQDISLWSYDRVVGCIRNIRNSVTYGEIALTIKPNVYRCGEVDDTEQTQVVPEVTHVAETVPRSDKLAQSLLLLKDSLDTGKIVRQFEQLYRKKPGMTMNDSKATGNINKNRYRDVVPYDATRVHIERSPTGDYINGNHVNMEIPSSGIVNRYIATQGPLAHTTGDFWYMIWEQGCTTIVMLTTLVEKGRIKCHQYWPSRKDTSEYGNLQITNISERLETHCHYRELSLKNKTTREERRVTQMQYTSWPDHGVPDNPKHFIDFVAEVRRARNGSLDPIIVHCSAGIGRTGVLILMETASCLIEANEPVYPLDIVRTMRDQRAMLIQTSEQYTFVCESILRAYKEDNVRPLAEYQKCR